MSWKRVIFVLLLAIVFSAIWLHNHQPSGDPLSRGLFRAAMVGDEEMAKWLLLDGYDANEREPDSGLTPLHMAASFGNTEVARILVRQGANINACDIDGLMPLHKTARFGSSGVAKLLLDKGVEDVDARSSMGLTPLHMAAMQGYTEIAAMLLEQGADTWAETPSGLNAGELAAGNGRYDTAILIMRHMLEHPRPARLVV